MANNEAIHSDLKPSYIADAALANPYVAVKLATARNTVELATANTDRAIGITQQTTESKEAVALKVTGYTNATVGVWDWTKGAFLTPGANGTLVATTTAGHLCCAIAMEAANAWEYGEVYILPYPMLVSALTS